jgi:hypothetical protein
MSDAYSASSRGRYETFIDDPRWQEHPDGSRTVSIFFGEEDDGLAVFGYHVPSSYRFPPHFHQTHYMSVILAGSLRVGRKWYRNGDFRMQEQGSVYGPEEAGPTGCTMLNIFADRRGLYPSLLSDTEPQAAEMTPDILLCNIWSPRNADDQDGRSEVDGILAAIEDRAR